MALSTITDGVHYVPGTIPDALQKEIPLDNKKFTVDEVEKQRILFQKCLLSIK